MTFGMIFIQHSLSPSYIGGSKGEGPGSNTLVFRTNEKSTTEEIPSSGLELEVPPRSREAQNPKLHKRPECRTKLWLQRRSCQPRKQVYGDNWTEEDPKICLHFHSRHTCVRTRRPVTLQAYLESLDSGPLSFITLDRRKFTPWPSNSK